MATTWMSSICHGSASLQSFVRLLFRRRKPSASTCDRCVTIATRCSRRRCRVARRRSDARVVCSTCRAMASRVGARTVFRAGTAARASTARSRKRLCVASRTCLAVRSGSTLGDSEAPDGARSSQPGCTVMRRPSTRRRGTLAKRRSSTPKQLWN